VACATPATASTEVTAPACETSIASSERRRTSQKEAHGHRTANRRIKATARLVDRPTHAGKLR
jgi:hypothetical protein